PRARARAETNVWGAACEPLAAKGTMESDGGGAEAGRSVSDAQDRDVGGGLRGLTPGGPCIAMRAAIDRSATSVWRNIAGTVVTDIATKSRGFAFTRSVGLIPRCWWSHACALLRIIERSPAPLA